MSLCQHGINLNNRRCDRCEEIAEAERAIRCKEFPPQSVPGDAWEKKQLRADQPLTIRIENEELVIRIGISALAYGVFSGDEWGGQVITDELQFAKDVMHELANEDEQGNTKFHFLLDDMANKAAENGSLGVGERKPLKGKL